MDFSTINKWTINGQEIKVLTINGQICWQKKEPTEITPFCVTNVSRTPATVKLAKVGDAPVVNLQYSTDNVTYQDWLDIYNTELSIPAGEKIFFKGTNNAFGKSLWNYNNFQFTNRVIVSGDITSLIAPDDGVKDLTGRNYCFTNLFSDCMTLSDAKYLILTSDKLSLYCYSKLFSNCKELKNPPELPAMQLADNCYSGMFDGCEQLVSAPVLMAEILAPYCYSNMFRKCIKLVSAPELPAMQLADNCYSGMFDGCEQLVSAPVLMAEILVLSCYDSMFYNCINLVDLPELPAMQLAPYCYRNMFYGCVKITKAPILPAMQLAPYCYSHTFDGCEQLGSAPELPAMQLADHCYDQIFHNCFALINPPKLPAMELAPYCYFDMFFNCRNLRKAPELPAKVLVDGCYSWMFEGCYNLNEIRISASNWIKIIKWCSGVCPSGTFYKPAELQVWDGTGEQPAGTIPLNSPDGIPAGWTVIEEKPEVTPFCVENISGVDNRITFEQSKKGAFDVNLEYSTDNKVWNKWFDYLTGSILLPANGKVYLRGKNRGINIISSDNVPNITYNRFVFEHNVSLSGDLTSLLDPAGNVLDLTGRDFCFNTIFKNNQTIIDASKLVIPCKTLCRASFRCMFEGCSEMLNAPVLPALYLANACYTGLFKGCKKLNNVTALFTSDPNTVMGTVDWLLGTSTTGTFRKNKNAKWERIDASGTNGWEIELVDPAII